MRIFGIEMKKDCSALIPLIAHQVGEVNMASVTSNAILNMQYIYLLWVVVSKLYH